MGGSTLEAFRRLLLLVLLQDNRVLQSGPLQASMLLTAEELLLARAPANQQDMLLSTWVNLVRMVNSGSAEIQGGRRQRRAALMCCSHMHGQGKEASRVFVAQLRAFTLLANCHCVMHAHAFPFTLSQQSCVSWTPSCWLWSSGHAGGTRAWLRQQQEQPLAAQRQAAQTVRMRQQPLSGWVTTPTWRHALLSSL